MPRRLPILKPIREAATLSRRTRVVWGAFAAAMTLACGVLVLGDAEGPRPVLLAGVTPEPRSDLGVLPRDAKADMDRWDSIVIHHSGTPAGDAASIARMHDEQGIAGLGYHFVIGNGQGMADGWIEIGPRWNRQLPGAHVAARPVQGDVQRAGLSTADHLNRHAIGICLVGNGDRRPFTDHQIAELAALVRKLQQQFRIPADRVFLHSDVAPVSSPGSHFPLAAFESQIFQTQR